MIEKLLESVTTTSLKESLLKDINENQEFTLKESPISSSLVTIESYSLEALEAQNAEKIENFEKSYQSIESMNISPEEKSIYNEAGLEKQVINGREVLIQPNLDLNKEFGPSNETNLERMRNGYAPLDENGNPYQLHHIGQNMDSPLAELTRDEHCSNGNYNVLHTKEGVSEIDRKEFMIERSNHWRERARLIDQN
jgi:hypothetical protein